MGDVGDGARDDLSAAARRTELLLTAMVAVVGLLLVSERAGYAGLYEGGGSATALALQLLFALPAILYLTGLWQLRVAARQVARGETFGAAVARALRRVGALLLAGAFATLVVMPFVYRLAGAPHPRLIDFDVTTLIVAAIGAALGFFARLIDRAAALRRELDEIF